MFTNLINFQIRFSRKLSFIRKNLILFFDLFLHVNHTRGYHQFRLTSYICKVLVLFSWSNKNLTKDNGFVD